MNRPKFILKEKTATSPTLVYLILRLHNQRMKFSTKLKINPDDWNFNTQRMKERHGLPYRNFNKILNNYETKVNDILLELEAEGKTPTVAQVKFRLQDVNGAENLTFNNVNEYCTHYLKKFEKRKPKSVRYFKIAANKLSEFNPRLHWADLNEITYNRFIGYLESKNYSKNYIGGILNKLRIIFNDAHREGYLKHTQFKAWKRRAENVYKVYLTEAEIEKIYNLELEGYLAHARDLFILGCCTGLRVENYLNIDPEINIQNNFINVVVNKNGPRVSIPVHWMVAELVQKYHGLPKPISEQKLNDYIKTVAEKAKINNMVQWFRTEGGQRVIYTQPKHELITSHTARRSFATNLLLRGELPENIMAVTGHRNREMFYKYIKITTEESSRKLAQSKFFKK